MSAKTKDSDNCCATVTVQLATQGSKKSSDATASSQTQYSSASMREEDDENCDVPSAVNGVLTNESQDSEVASIEEN